MKNVSKLFLVTLLSVGVLVFSCKKETTVAGTFVESDAYGRYFGKYSIIGLIEILDTISVTAGVSPDDGILQMTSESVGAGLTGTVNSDGKLTISEITLTDIALTGTATGDSILTATGSGSGKFVGDKCTFRINITAKTTLPAPLDDIAAPVDGIFNRES